MCFSVIIGKNASRTGNVLMAANDDWPGCPGHIHHVPRKSWTENDVFLTVKNIPIPQVEETFGYTFSACAYETGTRPVSWADGVNDQRVAVSMQGVYAFGNYQREQDLLEADDLAILLLERARTAREGIRLAGDLVSRYGFTVSTIEGAEGTVCMAVADPDEGFFLELLPGGHWCAKRVADDQAECRPNCFGIGEIDFSDSRNFMHSDGLYNFAVDQGLIRLGEPLNFAKTFGGDTAEINAAYGGACNPVNTMRKWTVLHRLGGLNIDPQKPVYSCQPKEAVGVRELMTLMRDHLQETPYALESAPEAGIHHNPFWMTVSTSIAQGGTVICMLADLSRRLPDALGCPVYFSLGNVRLTPFVPCYSGGRGLPEAYQHGECGEFDLSSAWWAFQETGELCYRNYEEIAPKEVIPSYDTYEETMFHTLEEAETTVVEQFANDSTEVLMRLMNLTDSLALQAMNTALSLGRYIKGKYLCNTVLEWL